MNFNFELILFYLVIISGVLALIDILFFEKKRKNRGIHIVPLVFDYAKSFFPVLLLVFFLRSFLFEPFRIPSSSLEPSLLVGDFIMVNKYDYGIRLPVIHRMVYPIGEPKRGDIIVFRWPPNPSVLFIKRVIGLPGDRIDYVNKVLTVNGQLMTQEFEKNATAYDEAHEAFSVVQKSENLFGLTHSLYQIPDRVTFDFQGIVVPEGMYFAMGDNRDDSADSRFFGFVPEANIVGKAVVVWMSWDSMRHTIRWDRLAKVVH